MLLYCGLKDLAVLADQHIKAAQRDPVRLSCLRLLMRHLRIACLGKTRGKGEFIIYPVVESIQTSNSPRKICIFRGRVLFQPAFIKRFILKTVIGAGDLERNTRNRKQKQLIYANIKPLVNINFCVCYCRKTSSPNSYL